MVVVIAVGARSQHRGKAMTGRIPQCLTKRFRNGFIGELYAMVASEDQGTDIDSVALAMSLSLASNTLLRPRHSYEP